MERPGDFEKEPAEEVMEITSKKSYWKFVLGVSAAGIFALGYCLGGSCNSSAGTENVFGKLLSGTVSVSSRAFSNIFGNGGESGGENLRETIDLNKSEKKTIEAPALSEVEMPALSKVEVASESPRLAKETQTGTPLKQTETIKECRFDSLGVPSHDKLIISEVGWMGAKGNPKHEWVELQNISGGSLNISGWQVLDSDEKVKIIFSNETLIPPQGFFLLKRGDESLPQIKADYVYSGGLENEGDGLRLFDSSCNLVDEIIADPTWPAGSASPKYLSAERSPDLSWHSYDGSGEAGIYGTPRKPNSEAEPPQPMQNQVATSGGGESVSGTPAESTPPAPPPPPPPSFQSEPVINHLLVSEIMVGVDGNAEDEFIELYNPMRTVMDLTGWSIKKKSSTGNESSLVVASRLKGKAIPAAKYFLLAREGGYSGGAVPDVWWPTSSAYALAYTNNSIVVYDSSGSFIEEISWTEIPKGNSYERESWGNTRFRIQINPNPQNSQSP
ncbi:MAG: lamin tail domain-containing protein [Candidatus Colwellbacteria bacterium]|nr:lamin tail domain-containing protein [Candidatus Colwellbacteria bacterium]